MLESHMLLLSSLVCLAAVWGAGAVRLHPRDATSLSLLASEWNEFNGSDTWRWRHADCMAMEGIRCDHDGYIVSIMLRLKIFGASIPNMISRFESLEALVLNYCEVTGSIPDALFSLQRLNALDLSGNSITGTLPGAFSRLTNLVYLDLTGNLLFGPITPLSNLLQLKALFLPDNSFSGSLANELGTLTSLEILYLPYNQFSGSLPCALGNLSLLQDLSVHHNQLTGTIPESFSGLHNLGILRLGSNQLTGTIPESLAFLSALIFLGLEYNLLDGSIPNSISSLQQLLRLSLSMNRLSGGIPVVLGDMTALQYLFLTGNPLSGTIPTSIGKLTNLLSLILSGNRLTGTIPSTFTNLSKLQDFLVAFNDLDGPIDPILRPMTDLSILFLTGNRFSGRVPSISSRSLTIYRVGHNFFTHGHLKLSNCSAVFLDTSGNCLAAPSVCGQASTQRPATACAAFCGLEVGATGPLCGGHGYCSLNPFTGEGECVCDPNYMVSSSNTNACVPGAAGASLASSSAYVSLQGSAAVPSNGSILLTGDAANQQGVAFASPALRLFYFPDKRSPCGTQLGFLVAFSFAMIPGDQGAGGEGLAFVVAAAAGKGASVGLGGVGRRSVAVEFDSVLSVKHSDPNDNHVGVNVGGSPVSLASATAPLILNDAHTKHAWIHYDPTSAGTLRVFLSSDPHQPPTPTLTASVSLCSVLKPTASDSLFLFGFVALSGSQPQSHAVLSWSFITDIPSSL